MTKAQWNFIKGWLFGIGIVSILAFMIAGMVLEEEWMLTIVFGLCSFLILYAVAIGIAGLVYRWRVMGATADNETDLFDRYWHWIIKDGYTTCKIKDIEEDDEWEDEEYKTFVLSYLRKIEKVPIPKILTI